MAQDPYAAIAKPLPQGDDPYASLVTPQSAGEGQGSTPNYGPGTTVVNPGWGDIGKGVLREGAQLGSGAYGFGRKAIEAIPGIAGSRFDQSMQRHQATLDDLAKPRNIGEAMGKTGGEMASYLLPAPLESKAVAAVPEFLRPAARIGVSALSNAGMSAANGEDPKTGALAGAGFGALGEGMRMAAPQLVRSAIPGGISADTARSVLNETRGIRPTTVLSSVNDRIAQAGGDLDRAVAAANQRPTPRIAGFLMPPKETIDLASIPGHEPASSPMAFPAASDRNTPRIYNQTQYHSGSEHPELSGRIDQPQGTMTRTPQMSASGPLPGFPSPTEPNSVISMRPFRQPLEMASSTAASQEAAKLHGEIEDMLNFTRRGRVSNEDIPDTVTPQRALDLRRGFNEQFLGNRDWGKVVNDKATSAGKQAYGGLSSELHEKVPGALEADETMSRLIPARNGLKALVKKDPSVIGNVSGRIGARTGALTAAAMGAASGKSAGLPGMVAGGITGLVAPEVMSAPSAKMLAGRTLYSAMTPRIGRAVMTPAVQNLMDNIRQKRIEDQGQ